MKKLSLNVLLPLSTLLCIGGCVSQPEPIVQRPRPTPPPVAVAPPPVAPTLGSDWRDWPLTPGDWVYRADARGSIAMFGVAGADASFTARCDMARRRVFLSRTGAFPAGDSGRMTIRASTGLQTYPVANSSEAPPYIAAELAPTDPHLDAMAFSRGRFIVSVKGANDLVIPAWPEIARVVEDCRG
jgi:hypothetical protein